MCMAFHFTVRPSGAGAWKKSDPRVATRAEEERGATWRVRSSRMRSRRPASRRAAALPKVLPATELAARGNVEREPEFDTRGSPRRREPAIAWTGHRPAGRYPPRRVPPGRSARGLGRRPSRAVAGVRSARTGPIYRVGPRYGAERREVEGYALWTTTYEGSVVRVARTICVPPATCQERVEPAASSSSPIP